MVSRVVTVSHIARSFADSFADFDDHGETLYSEAPVRGELRAVRH